MPPLPLAATAATVVPETAGTSTSPRGNHRPLARLASLPDGAARAATEYGAHDAAPLLGPLLEDALARVVAGGRVRAAAMLKAVARRHCWRSTLGQFHGLRLRPDQRAGATAASRFDARSCGTFACSLGPLRRAGVHRVAALGGTGMAGAGLWLCGLPINVTGCRGAVAFRCGTLARLANGLRPIEEAIVEETLPHEEVLEETAEVGIVRAVLKAQRSAIVEVRGEDRRVALAEGLHRR
mmetsp:Transcript_8773/g.24362  ORF Transcript_8773/g.24362 Transcript_8773/m.24362 type:complete len:239 (+) Transcript_8773:190-906(+)